MALIPDEEQVTLRQKLVETLRADSDMIRDHLKLVEYMMSDPEKGTLWCDLPGRFSDKDVEMKFDNPNILTMAAHRYLTKALEEKIVSLLPSLCREVLDDASKKADMAMVRAAQTSVIDAVDKPE